MMRAVHGTTVLYPSDATSAAYLIEQMAERTGIVYMRTTRGAYPVLYGPDEAFPIGEAKVVRSSPQDQVTLIGAGVTLHNCLAAAGQLAGDGIRACIVDLYSVKSIYTQTLLQAAAATGTAWWSSRTTTPRAASAARSWTRSTTRATRSGSATWPSGTCPAPGRPPSSWRRPGSPPTRSPRPPATCSAADAVETRARGARPPSPGMRRCQYAHLALCRRQRCGVWSAMVGESFHPCPAGRPWPSARAPAWSREASVRASGWPRRRVRDSSVPGSS